MKKIILYLSLSFAFDAQANDVSTVPIEERPSAAAEPSEAKVKEVSLSKGIIQDSTQPSEFGKLSYIPKEGVGYADIEYSSSTVSAKLSRLGNTLADIKSNSNSFGYLLGFGITDSFSMGLQGRVYTASSNDYSYGPGSTVNGTSENYLSSGPTDPRLLFSWRIRDNAQRKTKADFAFGFRPKIQVDKSASATKNGNMAAGRNEYMLNLNFFKEINNLEIQLSAQRNQYAAGKSEDVSDTTKTSETSEYGSSEFQFKGMARVSESMMFGGGLNINNTEVYNNESYTNGVKGSTTQSGSLLLTSIEVEARVLLDDKAMFKLTVNSLLGATGVVKSGTTTFDYTINSGVNIAGAWVQEF